MKHMASILVAIRIFQYVYIIELLYLLNIPESFTSFNDVVVYLIVGSILFLICGGLSLATLPQDCDGKLAYFIATGFFIANGIIFLIDFILETKNK